MRREAESHAEDDRKKRELIDERNKADQMVYQIEKLLKENGDKVNETDKAPILSAVERVKQVSKGSDLAAIKQAVADLERASHAMAQHLYSKAGPGAAGVAVAPVARRRAATARRTMSSTPSSRSRSNRVVMQPAHGRCARGLFFGRTGDPPPISACNSRSTDQQSSWLDIPRSSLINRPCRCASVPVAPHTTTRPRSLSKQRRADKQEAAQESKLMTWFTNRTTRVKLLLSFGLLTILVGVVAAVGYQGIRTMSESLARDARRAAVGGAAPDRGRRQLE